MRRRLILTAGVLAAGVLLAGCTNEASDSQSFVGTDMSESVPGPVELRSDNELPSTVFEGEQPASADRQVIVSGTFRVTVKDPLEAADDATRVVESAGGHVDHRAETAPRGNDRGRAELTVRIPAAERTETLRALEELGTVEETTLRREDVTSTATDLDARITALEASVDRLLALMADASTTADLITIESTLSERQASLESMQAQRRAIADQVEYSTITLHFGTKADAPVSEPDTFLSGLITGWEALVTFVSFLLVALGVVLPWLVIPAIALLVLLLVVRRRRSRGAEAPVAASAADEEDEQHA